MTNELKPCPFCGEQPKLTDCAYDALTIIECESCKKTRDRVVRFEYALHDQAIEAWNTRAERTVKVVEQVSTGYHLEDDKVRLSCGHIVNGRLPRTIPTYCDTCGAKVVSE